VKYCKKCFYPDTKPQLNFDENGVCDACKWSEAKNSIDWNKRKIELENILNKYRNKDGRRYDCLIPVSGGRDSHFITYVILKEYGLNPLLVNFHPQDTTDIGKKNLENLKKMGVDCIEMTPNPTISKKLAKFGLVELGDFQWPQHIGIFTTPYQIAVAYKIPLIVWAETPSEVGSGPKDDKIYFLDRDYEEKYCSFFLDKIKPENMTEHGFEYKDLLPYIFPSKQEIEDVGIIGIFLGHYIKWDVFKQLEIVKKLGFQEESQITEGTYDSWENLDVKYQGFHDYFKFLKFGFGRATDHVSMEIRYGRMTREEGLAIIKKYEGKVPTRHLDEFLRDAEISMDEFIEICEKFTNKKLFKTDSNGNLIRDNEGNIEKLYYDNSD
jgi:N-acetyl sugar amidotransferase